MIQYENGPITVFQSALYQTTSTVIDTGDLVLIVDPNWLPEEIKVIQKFVEDIRGERQVFLLFTHGDFDHVIGYKAFPGAKVIGSTGLVHHPDKAKKVEMIHQFDNDYYIERDHSIAFPEVDFEIKEDGEQLVFGKTLLRFFLAPGHTHDGLFTLVEPLGIWITGDYLSDFELPFIYYSAKAYEETLKKAEHILETYKVSVMVPGHGKATESKEDIKRRIQLSISYLERLIEAVQLEDAQKLELLGQEMKFPSSFTKQSHVDNVAIVKKEFPTKGT